MERRYAPGVGGMFSAKCVDARPRHPANWLAFGRHQASSCFGANALVMVFVGSA
jgi:hypothetical protein